MIITLLVLITTVNAIITPGFNVGIDLRKDGAIESATVVSPDGNIFYILTDTKLIAINTNNRQKIGSFSFALDEKPIKFVVDHTNNFAYVFLDDMIEYKIFLKEISITIGAGPSVTFASTGRLLSLPNRMELSISQISNLIFTQMPTAFVSEPLRRIFYWENIAIPTSYTLRAIDAVTFTILGGTPPRTDANQFVSPRLTSDGLYCWAIINQYSSANPAILVQIDLTNLSFIKNIYITSWISTSAGELIMTINQAQNTVYWTQVYGTTSQNIWKGVIAADGSISVTPLGPVGILGLPREMQLNNSDTQLVMSTVGVGGYGAVNVLVFSTVNGSLIGRTTLTSANYPWLTAFDGALILQKNLAIFTTKRSYQWIYPSAIFSANIANLVGTVTNRDNPVVVLDNLMFRTDTFFFSHDNSQLFVIGYNDSNYGINILSLNPTTFAVNSRYFYALTGTIWSWPIFMSSAVNSAASTFSLFYYIQGLITNIVISYTGGVLTLHPSTRPWVYVPVISYVTDPGVGATDIANGRQIVVGPSGFLLNLNNLTNIIGNFTTGTNNGGKLFLDASGNSGYYHNRLIFQMDFSTNFPTFVSNSSSSVTFFDFSMGSTYGVGLANGVLRTISKSNLTSVLSNFYWTNYRLSPDLFLFDPTSQIGFIHSVRFSQSGAYWAGIGGALLPIITTGGTLSQNSNGIELIFTGDELIKKVLRRPDNTFLFLSQKGYIYTFSASTVTSCTGAYCRLSSSLPATTQSFTTGGITTRGITTRSVTSGSMTTGIVTSGSITTGSVTTGDFTPGTCGGNMTSPTGTFSRYPYPASDYCIWYFDFGAGYSNITFTFTVFDLDNFWDDFRIYNSRDIIGIYSEISSPPTPQPFTTQQSYATILFDAGPFTPRTGFIINYRANSRSGIPTTGLATSGAATSGKVTSGYAVTTGVNGGLVTTGVNGGLVTTGVMDSSSSSSSSSTEGTTGNEQESVSALLAINISLVLLGLLI